MQTFVYFYYIHHCFRIHLTTELYEHTVQI
nr:MAG TPA: hypothetical protein [Crassvirales sp.]